MYAHVKEHSMFPCASYVCQILLQVSSLPFDVLLTTYDIALVDQDFLSQIPWYYAIIDEAQRLKNPSSVCFRFMYPLTCIHVMKIVDDKINSMLYQIKWYSMFQMFCSVYTWISL